MLNEEENEAIKYLEFLSNEKCECEACQKAKKEYKTILNLLDKQQKEITKLSEKVTNNICANVENEVLEEYRQKIKDQQKEIEEWRNGIRINDKVSIPKDKIRAKIQLYKDKKADSIGMLINYEYWKAKIDILKELLEENNNEQ